jgi:hypothetical protein
MHDGANHGRTQSVREREHIEWCSDGRLRARRSLSAVLVLLGRIEHATLLRQPAQLILDKLWHPYPPNGGGLGYGGSPILSVPTPTERAPGFSRGLELNQMLPYQSSASHSRRRGGAERHSESFA